MSLFQNRNLNQGGGGQSGGQVQQQQSSHSPNISPSKEQDHCRSGGGLFGGGGSRGGIFGGGGDLFGGGGGPFGRGGGTGLFSGGGGTGLFSEDPNHGVCLHHRKPLELFCKADKLKICVNCAYSEAHKGHDIDLIENMRLGMCEKGVLYERSLKKSQDSKHHIESFIYEKAKPFDKILKERQRNEEITRLKAWFLIQHYIDCQKVNFERTLKKKSLSEKELRATAQDYKRGSDAGLVKTATETFEEIKVRFDDSVFEGLSVEIKEAIQEQSENLKNELNEIYNQEGGDVLKLKSHFFVKKGQNHLELETRSETESFEFKLNDLKEVASVSIIYEKAWLHEEDLNFLKLVLLNLSSLDSLSLHCKASVTPQVSGMINGCSIFTHLLQSFQLAINLPLNKLQSFVFVSESKNIDEHNQISRMILNLTSTMNSLKLVKIHLNHLFEDSIQKEWEDLKALERLIESKEPEELKDLRELTEFIERDKVKNARKMIKEKELKISKKFKINSIIKILDILIQNQSLKNAEFTMPNVEIDERDLKFLRDYRFRNPLIQELQIKAKNFDSSKPDERNESKPGGLFGQSQAELFNGSGAGGGLFEKKPATSTEHPGREGEGAGIFGMRPATPTEHSGRGRGDSFGNKSATQIGNPGRSHQGEKRVSFHLTE